MSEKFRLGDRPRWGETTCGFGVDAPACNQLATKHVMWLESLATSLTCDEHMAFIEANADRAYETHAHGGDCGMPGALWHHPYEDEEEGYCFFPVPDDLALVVEESLPQEVQACSSLSPRPLATETLGKKVAAMLLLALTRRSGHEMIYS